MKKTLLIIILIYFLQACSSKKEFALNINNDDDVNLYNKAMVKLKSKEFEEAILTMGVKGTNACGICPLHS